MCTELVLCEKKKIVMVMMTMVFFYDGMWIINVLFCLEK